MTVLLLVLLAKLISVRVVVTALLAVFGIAAVYFIGALIYNAVTRKKLINRFKSEKE